MSVNSSKEKITRILTVVLEAKVISSRIAI